MKKLIISDTHLSKFNKKQFAFLKDLISSVDQVIINGDFWDSWCISFEKFVNSRWQQLFDLLLEKKTVYIHGNHDPKHLCDERCSLFAVETCDSYQFELFGQKFHCEHGHRLMTGFDMGKVINIYLKLLHRRPKVICYIVAKSERLLFNLFPKIGSHSKVGRRTNRILKENLKPDHVNIFGHSHYSTLDFSNNFINTGSIMCKHASYVLIDEEKIRLEKHRY
jgi:predicted phosphodiesterase